MQCIRVTLTIDQMRHHSQRTFFVMAIAQQPVTIFDELKLSSTMRHVVSVFCIGGRAFPKYQIQSINNQKYQQEQMATTRGEAVIFLGAKERCDPFLVLLA